MSSGAEATVFEDSFEITSLIADKYDRVSRVMGSSAADSSTALTLDINHELYPLTPGDRVQMVLATTLNLDGTKDERGWRAGRDNETLSQFFDYVCYGKVYRFEEGEEGRSM